jgi:hypothetical protein
MVRSFLRRAGVVLAVGGLGLAGCGAETGDGDASTFCEADCAWAIDCGAPLSLSDCMSGCTAEKADLKKVREDLVEGWSVCFESLTCSLGSQDELKQCEQEYEVSLEPSPIAVEYCKRAATWSIQCGYSADTPRCIETVKGWSDRTLEALTGCRDTMAVSCEGDELKECIDRVLGRET